jgi:hypothetical protein
LPHARPREREKYEERKREKEKKERKNERTKERKNERTKERCRMPGRRVKGSFARVPRPLTRRTGEAAAEEV